MDLLLVGIVVFLAVHSLAVFRGLRARLVERLGLMGFRAAFSMGALLGLGLIIWGFARYRAAGLIVVWTPPPGMRHLTMTLMWFAFVALVSSRAGDGRIRGWLRHPLLVSLKTWALAHLLANGDAGGMALFGAFLAWGVVDRIALKKRGDLGAPRLDRFTRADALSLVGGTVAYVAMLFLHPLLIGVSVLAG